MEKLLQYVWHHKMFGTEKLMTTSGESIEVLDSGLVNRDAGPDFFNAKVRIGGVTWVGNIEVHMRASDWLLHRHSESQHYDNVILHVVSDDNLGEQPLTASGKVIPTLVLHIPESLATDYRQLLTEDEYPRCHRILPSMPRIKVTSWLDALLTERLEQRSALVRGRALRVGGNWEQAFFITLARNFGFSKNGDNFERWAEALPLTAIAHHRDNPFQVEAMFLGIAGLLKAENLPSSHRDAAISDKYRQRLLREFEYLCIKFGIDRDALPNLPWKFMRMRPQSFPHMRIVQLADMYCRLRVSLSSIIEAASLKDLESLLECNVSEYWQTHYTFGMASDRVSKHLTISSRRLIIINTVVPVLWAYGTHIHKETLKQKAIALLEELKSEQNYITRQWQACGITVDTAAHTQALIQLKLTRCDRYDCLRCRFGYDYLKGTK